MGVLTNELLGADGHGEKTQQDHCPSMTVPVVDVIILNRRKFTGQIRACRKGTYISTALADFPVHTNLKTSTDRCSNGRITR